MVAVVVYNLYEVESGGEVSHIYCCLVGFHHKHACGSVNIYCVHIHTFNSEVAVGRIRSNDYDAVVGSNVGYTTLRLVAIEEFDKRAYEFVRIGVYKCIVVFIVDLQT